jgi:hypothetical protein
MSISRDEPDPIATVVDWLDACRNRRICALLDLYDEAATLECACDGINSLTGRAALEAYWRPKLTDPSPGSFSMDDVTTDGAGVIRIIGVTRASRCGFTSASMMPAKSCTRDAVRWAIAPPEAASAAVAAQFVDRYCGGFGLCSSRTMKRSPLQSSMSWLSTNFWACSIASASPEQDSPTNLTKCPSSPTKYTRYSVTRSPHQRMDYDAIKRLSGTSGNSPASYERL